jgi:hypothetical protein
MIQKRKAIRLKKYDYSQAGMYFVNMNQSNKKIFLETYGCPRRFADANLSAGTAASLSESL